MNSQNHITRRKTRQIMVGNVAVGGDAPISVQSMTNTETCDVDATLKQIQRLVTAGVDIVRVSVPSMDAAAAFKEIRSKVSVPLVADIHFDHLIALQVLESGVDCLRINPGNIGSEKRIRAVVDSAKDKGIPLRIGVNAGSLGKTLLRKYKEPSAEAMVESALTQIDILDKLDFQNFKISLKASEIFMTLTAYRQLATQIDQPLHLGITEAGGLRSGTVKSAIGLSALLMEGIGDTIRISLAADPVEEVKVGFDILKSLGLRHKGVNLVACPSCSRQNFDVISVVNELEARLEDITTPIDVAVIGCIVNGPGEAKVAEIGLTGASPNNLAYVEGVPSRKIQNATLVDDLEAMVRARVALKKDVIASS
ncbi:MAG: flavodoxin-dependent (E)-4-hydroxy-3-methylbut-2-enyl-diphosphate synthase [OM182 bacterium]|nr:flavodoxin-dependent (E)-4-hydroxy-3-methylbut-2-enyl-diphosphate synthase [OM182 bacterium]